MNSVQTRLSWEEIKQHYPHQNVGIIDAEKKPDSEIIVSGIVKFTDRDMTYDDFALLAMQNKIELRYTTLDEDEFNNINMR